MTKTIENDDEKAVRRACVLKKERHDDGRCWRAVRHRRRRGRLVGGRQPVAKQTNFQRTADRRVGVTDTLGRQLLIARNDSMQLLR